MPAYTTRDNGPFAGTSQRCQLSTRVAFDIPLTTTAAVVWQIDTAEIGAVNASLTIQNISASIGIVLTCWVSNDKDSIPSSAGRVTLTSLYSEADAAIPLPLTIAAAATDHVILGYKNQPMLTTFRYWNFALASASSTATASIFGNAK